MLGALQVGSGSTGSKVAKPRVKHGVTVGLEVDMEVLMKMQNGYDIVQARKRWDEVEIAAAA